MFYKGPFWVVCENSLNEIVFPKSDILSFPVPCATNPTPSHINVWKQVCGEHKKAAWNYYPRGRVEIRKDKAIVYANPICFLYDKLEINLRKSFHLGEIEIINKSDNSTHYANGVFNYYN